LFRYVVMDTLRLKRAYACN